MKNLLIIGIIAIMLGINSGADVEAGTLTSGNTVLEQWMERNQKERELRELKKQREEREYQQRKQEREIQERHEQERRHQIEVEQRLREIKRQQEWDSMQDWMHRHQP